MSTYEERKFLELLENYFIYDNEHAEFELKRQTIDGKTLVYSLDTIKSRYEGISKYEGICDEKENLEEKLNEFCGELESLVKGKNGDYVDKLINIIEKYKPKKNKTSSKSQ